jgi:hypothetical protein
MPQRRRRNLSLLFLCVVLLYLQCKAAGHTRHAPHPRVRRDEQPARRLLARERFGAAARHVLRELARIEDVGIEVHVVAARERLGGGEVEAVGANDVGVAGSGMANGEKHWRSSRRRSRYRMLLEDFDAALYALHAVRLWWHALRCLETVRLDGAFECCLLCPHLAPIFLGVTHPSACGGVHFARQ